MFFKLFSVYIYFFPKKIFFVALLNFFTIFSFSLITYIELINQIIIFVSTVVFHFLLLKFSKIHEYKFYFEVLLFNSFIILNFLILDIEITIFLIIILFVNNCVFTTFDFFWTHKDRI